MVNRYGRWVRRSIHSAGAFPLCGWSAQDELLGERVVLVTRLLQGDINGRATRWGNGPS